MKRIAVEEHFYPHALTDYLRAQHGPAWKPRARAGREYIEKRLQDMAEAGIDMQVLSVGMLGLHDLPPADGAAMSRDMDDELAEIVQTYPDKFAALAAIAPQAPEAAADELERAVKQLGMKGALINSHVQGEYLDEEKYWVILERAAALRVPLYIHPNRPAPDMLKPYLKYPPLWGAFWGFGAETGLHAMRLICSGVLDRYPDLTIILGHLGEALPFWMWRLDRHWLDDRNPEEVRRLPKKPSEYIRESFYVTTSGMFWSAVLQFVYHALSAERMLFAVDYPIESNTASVRAVEEMSISEEERAKIFHLNAERILKL